MVSNMRYGNGHINETYLFVTDSGNGYILQKINESVFQDVDGLMSNIEAVTNFLRSKQTDERSVLQLVKTEDGKPYLRHTDATAWRVYVLVTDAIWLWIWKASGNKCIKSLRKSHSNTSGGANHPFLAT